MLGGIFLAVVWVLLRTAGNLILGSSCNTELLSASRGLQKGCSFGTPVDILGNYRRSSSGLGGCYPHKFVMAHTLSSGLFFSIKYRANHHCSGGLRCGPPYPRSSSFRQSHRPKGGLGNILVLHKQPRTPMRQVGCIASAMHTTSVLCHHTTSPTNQCVLPAQNKPRVRHQIVGVAARHNPITTERKYDSHKTNMLRVIR